MSSDEDINLPMDLMAGRPNQAILDTIYNGSTPCQYCGSLINPTTALYLGSICPDCVTERGASRVQNLVGK